MALNISRGVVFKAQKCVIYGPEGIGKSTFAAQFPEPVFIDTEGSTNLMDVARFPRPTSWTMLVSMVKEVISTPGICKTLVVDTIDWAEQMCVEHVCATHNKKGIEDFGYGNGYVYVKEEFGRFLNLLTDVIDRNINVVLTAHSQMRKFESPEEAGAYDRYELKLGKKTSSQTSPLIKEWADMVLFANYKIHVIEIEKKKKSTGGARVMYTTHHPCWDAKNRHDLKAELPFEFAQIAYCIPNHVDAAQKPVAEQMKPVTEAVKSVTAPPVTDKEATKAQPVPIDIAVLPKPLADLMLANSVTVEEIQSVVADKGYYPKDTLIKNYDPGFIDGVLIGAWDQVFSMISTMRQVPFK